ncbi:DUF2294 family protein [Paenibacillus rhizovicinus]|uniref:DUF2294 family protein n=1 Tax=Paenibacillus rhizovicinus TaxID=2704463 RepID=A0A6C0P3G5_9BACL|nr:Na-translocating system protein MpsC family protein [Paenibacillus rhizovicinus]QHW33038.1 DUF2294 family protein [Paenibacillus rhizovicinus]
MDLRETELYLERTFNRGRKEISGRGPLSTKVRIVDDVIFVKMKMEYSGLSLRLFRFVSECKQEDQYYDSVRDDSRVIAAKILSTICDLQILAMHFKIDIDNRFSFTTIILDGDLENLIVNGKVMKPD